MIVHGMNHGVHFGRITDDEEIGEWRGTEAEDESDPDDEELENTPEDVIAILGFDPKEL